MYGVTPVMQNQMEKDIEHEMDIGIMYRLIGLMMIKSPARPQFS